MTDQVPFASRTAARTLAYTLIGGTFAGTVLTLVFLPAMYAIWFRIASRSRNHEVGNLGGDGARSPS